MTFRSFLPYEPETSNYFNLTTTELITLALNEIGIGINGENIEPEYYNRALYQLNLVITELMSQGLHIATYRTGSLFLQPNQYKYVIEDEHATDQYYKRQLTANYAAGSTVLAVSSVAGVAANDYYGVTMDDGSIFWTSVSTFDPIAKTVTIALPLPGSTTSGNYCLNYTTPIGQIVRINQFWRTDSYINDIPMTMISRQEYDVLPYKTSAVSSGVPSQAYYERSLPKGTLFLWMPPQNGQYIVNFWYERRLGQMVNATDTLGLDQTYLPAVVKHTAYRLCNTFRIGTEVYQRVKMEAEELMDRALSFDDEQTPFKISLYRET